MTAGQDAAGAQPQLAEVVELELQLLEPATRRDRAELERLLHPEFREVGASGKTWDRDALIEALTHEQGPVADVERLAARPVAGDVVLVTYLAASRGRRSLRSSLWVHSHGWRMLFHQGTPVDSDQM